MSNGTRTVNECEIALAPVNDSSGASALRFMSVSTRAIDQLWGCWADVRNVTLNGEKVANMSTHRLRRMIRRFLCLIRFIVNLIQADRLKFGDLSLLRSSGPRPDERNFPGTMCCIGRSFHP